MLDKEAKILGFEKIEPLYHEDVTTYIKRGITRNFKHI